MQPSGLVTLLFRSAYQVSILVPKPATSYLRSSERPFCDTTHIDCPFYDSIGSAEIQVVDT